MIATRSSTEATMLKALAYTSNAFDAAISLDVDRSDDDRAFFTAEKATIDALFDEIESIHRNVMLHLYRVQQKFQARIELGDSVLDRGIRAGKRRMGLELQHIDADAANRAFHTDISEIVDAERHVEPGLALECVDRFKTVPDFPGKAALAADIQGRAERQAQNFVDRNAASRAEADLDATLEHAIGRASDALYRSEKRLLDRFPRDKVYVRSFFYDVTPTRKKKSEE